MFVRAIIELFSERFPRSSRLHLQSAYLNHERLNNKFKALFELMMTEENKPSL